MAPVKKKKQASKPVKAKAAGQLHSLKTLEKDLTKHTDLFCKELLNKEFKGKVQTGKVKVKYRHPENFALEWTGRGRQPKWVAEWMAKGGKMESLAV